MLPEGLDRFPFCDDRLVLVAPSNDEIAARRQTSFRDVAERDFVGLTEASALQSHIAGQAAKLGVRLRLRARLRGFDAICQMVEAGVGLVDLLDGQAAALGGPALERSQRVGGDASPGHESARDAERERLRHREAAAARANVLPPGACGRAAESSRRPACAPRPRGRWSA